MIPVVYDNHRSYGAAILAALHAGGWSVTSVLLTATRGGNALYVRLAKNRPRTDGRSRKRDGGWITATVRKNSDVMPTKIPNLLVNGSSGRSSAWRRISRRTTRRK